jgi:hypothetical protein
MNNGTVTVIVGFVIGAGLTCVPIFWRAGRNFGVLIHELGHAVVGLLVGRRLMSVRVNNDTSGVTVTAGKDHGIGRVLTVAAGYPAPGVVAGGLLFALLKWDERWATLTAAGVLLVGAPFWRGVKTWSVVLVCGVTVTGLWFTPGGVAAFGWGVVGGFLIAASPRMIIELHKSRRIGSGVGHSDADVLAEFTHLPAVMWEGVFFVLSFFTLFVTLTFLSRGQL